MLNANTEVFKNIKKFFSVAREQISKGSEKLVNYIVWSYKVHLFSTFLITVMFFLNEGHNCLTILIFNCCYFTE